MNLNNDFIVEEVMLDWHWYQSDTGVDDGTLHLCL